MKYRKGFTLIELLVVIAIIAILAIVVILTLNPAQLIQQARDSNRVSDFATVKSAIGYYLEDVTNPSLGIGTAGATCYEDGPVTSGSTSHSTTTCPWFATATSTVVSTTSRATNTSSSASWIPINLSSISVGAPIGQWPIDPLNTISPTSTLSQNTSTDHFYSFAASTSTTNYSYKLGVHMESVKYVNGGSGDLETTDGGSNANEYEQGSSLSL